MISFEWLYRWRSGHTYFCASCVCAHEFVPQIWSNLNKVFAAQQIWIWSDGYIAGAVARVNRMVASRAHSLRQTDQFGSHCYAHFHRKLLRIFLLSLFNHSLDRCTINHALIDFIQIACGHVTHSMGESVALRNRNHRCTPTDNMKSFWTIYNIFKWNEEKIGGYEWRAKPNAFTSISRRRPTSGNSLNSLRWPLIKRQCAHVQTKLPSQL